MLESGVAGPRGRAHSGVRVGVISAALAAAAETLCSYSTADKDVVR